MNLQIITTDAGEELVVLPRRDYDSLLARLGDEAAEDRMTARIVEESRARIDRGDETVLPAWLAEEVARGNSPVRVARKKAGRTQADLAAAVGITQGDLSDIESSRKTGAPDVLARIAGVLDLDPAWLQDA